MERARIPIEEYTEMADMPHTGALDLATLDRLIEEAPIGVGMVDRSMRFVRINDRLAQINHLPASAHIGRSAVELFPSHSRIWLPLWQQVIQTGEPVIELELSSDTFDSHPDDQRYLLVSYYPVRQADGTVIGVGLLVQDITERKRAAIGRHLLAHLAKQLITLNTPRETLSFVMREVGEHFRANRCIYSDIDMQSGSFQFVDAYERGVPTLAGGRFTLAQCGALDTYLLAGESIAVADTSSDPRTAMFAAEYAATQTAAFLCMPRVREGQCVGALMVSSSTPRHWIAYEVALLRSAADLLWLALERARLFQEAHTALQARDQFLSLAAHELRTPLTVLLGQTQLALRRANRQGTASELDLRGLEQIVRQARHLKEMIGDLLDTSRLDEGQMRISPKPVEVVSLVVQLVEETRETMPMHMLQVNTPDTPITISGDTGRLTQLLHNLLSNAAKYSPGGGDIHIRVEPIGTHVHISVRDHGIGIPADSIPKVCDRFYRASNAEQAHIEGLGIGLYIVREIVTLHGGNLHIESTEGQGSTFVVELPSVG